MSIDIESFLENLEMQEENDVEKMRQELSSMLSNGESSLFPKDKTPWTVGRLEKTSNKRIRSLYHQVNKAGTADKVNTDKDIISKLLAMRDFNAFLEKYKSNFLTSRHSLSLPTILTFQVSVTERLLASLYGNVKSYLPYISSFCQVFENLDWETAAVLYDQKVKEQEKNIDRLESEDNVINERRDNIEIDESEE